MKLIVIFLMGALGGFSGIVLANNIKNQPEILTADEYCQSQGYNEAWQKDVTETGIKRVQCKLDKKDAWGYAWFQYPPKTDLQNYCEGNL